MSKSHEFDYDVLVIGAGPGGYVAAIRAAQLGLRVACIDKRKTLGGTCLNVGCIPSKALLHASHEYEKVNKGVLEKYGINVPAVSVDLDIMQKNKGSIVNDLTSGIAFLFKKHKIKHITGKATFSKPHHVRVKCKEYSSNHIVIATGSTPSELKGLELNGNTIVNSTGGLEFTTIPQHLAVIGGGVIGLELGSVWNRLGAKVTVIEYQQNILGNMDSELCSSALSLFKKQGLEFKLGTKVISEIRHGEGHKIIYEDRVCGDVTDINVSHILVATGRRPYTDDLNVQAIGLHLNPTGLIEVNERLETNVKNVWAIGDVIPGLMLAHRAEDEGIAVAENISGLESPLNHAVLPNIVYTHPEIASVGLNEEEAKLNHKINIGKFPFLANSRAKANSDTDGFVKVISDAQTNTVLGVHIIGSQAGNMIAQASQAMEFGATSEDIAYSCHAHPTHAEALKEAALAVIGQPIHI